MVEVERDAAADVLLGQVGEWVAVSVGGIKHVEALTEVSGGDVGGYRVARLAVAGEAQARVVLEIRRAGEEAEVVGASVALVRAGLVGPVFQGGVGPGFVDGAPRHLLVVHEVGRVGTAVVGLVVVVEAEHTKTGSAQGRDVGDVAERCVAVRPCCCALRDVSVEPDGHSLSLRRIYTGVSRPAAP